MIQDAIHALTQMAKFSHLNSDFIQQLSEDELALYDDSVRVYYKYEDAPDYCPTTLLVALDMFREARKLLTSTQANGHQNIDPSQLAY